MINSSLKHPDDIDLASYLARPDSTAHSNISLHLAGCADCRKQVEMMSLLKTEAAALHSETCDEQQQQKVDEFIYRDLSGIKKVALRTQITGDPAMLKSALHSLTQKNNKPLTQQSQPQSSPATSIAGDWFQKLISSWFSLPVTALATMVLTFVVIQSFGLFSKQDNSISIASFQDNQRIRFLSQNKMPGIGFFSSAGQQSEPFQNLKISFSEDQQLNLEWQPVSHARDYNLTLSRYSDGQKQLHDKITVSTTFATITLNEDDFNQRFEWTLSGDTTQGKTFITSGGFVIMRDEN